MTYQEFKSAWKAFNKSTKGFLKLPLSHPLEFHVGYASSARKALVIMDTGKLDKIPCSNAISAENRQLINGKWSLELQLLIEEYEEEFLCLGWDIIICSKDADDPARALVDRYLDWQKLLQYVGKGVMSFSRQKGLIAELIHLQEIIQQKGLQNALTAWVGPDGADQDFVYEESWEEIKAISLAAETVKISSFEQLMQEKSGFLLVYVLEKSTPGEDRVVLSNLVEMIRNGFSQSSLLLDKFNIKLFKYGYRDRDVEEYDRNCFRYIERRDYIVDSEFPKLTQSNTPVEIVAGSYLLSLAAIEKYKR
ncbi:Putative PD-(D/E)XK family member [Ruminococcaceae bacterium KH2T8]|nr:Putative PD-(D/E)XK family member [Ruminococcaceae bacterium KH2T8]